MNIKLCNIIKKIANHYYNDFKYKDHPDVRTRFIPHQEAKGVGYARNLIQQELFIDEDYFLQIDSHSRAIKDWDKILIKQINNCSKDFIHHIYHDEKIGLKTNSAAFN